MLYRFSRFPLAARAHRSHRFYAKTATSPLGSDTTIEHNTLSETNKLSKNLTKFWDQVGLKETETHYSITLDDKPIRTPLGNDLSIPKSRKLLSHLILHEWSSLTNSHVKTHALPLTSLTSRVIDLEQSNESQNEEQLTKVGSKSDIIEQLLRYLDTDTLLVFSPVAEYQGALRKAQDEKYLPVKKEIEDFLGVELTYLDSDRDGLRGNLQTEETREKARQYLHSLNYWDLVALEKITLSAKSLICGILVVRSKNSKDVEHKLLEDVAELATLEIIYQTEKWGEVEDTHDVDYQDIRRNISSAAILSFEERS